MKYINKIDWSKVEKEIILVTNTNLGSKYSPIFEAHKVNPNGKKVIELGLFDKNRILKICNDKNILISGCLGWSMDWNTIQEDNNQNIDGFMAQNYKNVAKWFIGRIMGFESFKISKFV